MIQLFVVFSFFVWIISLLGWGFFANLPIGKYFKFFEVADEFKILYYGLLGLTIISVIGTICNFFIPLDQVFSAGLLLAGLVLFAIYQKNIFTAKYLNKTLILFAFIYGSIFPLLNLGAYDTGLYHLQVINWISGHALSFGLANVHDRFGFNSAWFVAAAIVSPLKVIIKSPFFIINAIVFFFYGTFIFLTLKRMMSEAKMLLSSIFVLTTFIPWFFCLTNFISSPSPDVPMMLLTFFVTFLLIKTLETKSVDYLFVALVVSFFVVTLKLAAVPYFVEIFLILLLGFIFKNYLKKKNYLVAADLTSIKYIIAGTGLLVMGLPYAIRGVISSGYLAFPSTLGRLNVKWAVPVSTATDTANWVKSWARKPLTDWHEVLGNWNWLKPWFFNLFSNDRFLALTFVVAIVVMVTCIFLKKKKDVSIFLIVAFLSFLGCLFWFFSAPDPRFGYGYLYSFFGFLIGYGIYNFVDNEKIKNIFLKFTCFAVLFLFVFHIFNGNVKLKELRSVKKFKDVEFLQRKTNDNLTVYTPVKGDQCYNSPLPCTPYFNENLKIVFDKKNNPVMFWVENKN